MPTSIVFYVLLVFFVATALGIFLAVTDKDNKQFFTSEDDSTPNALEIENNLENKQSNNFKRKLAFIIIAFTMFIATIITIIDTQKSINLVPTNGIVVGYQEYLTENGAMTYELIVRGTVKDLRTYEKDFRVSMQSKEALYKYKIGDTYKLN